MMQISPTKLPPVVAPASGKKHKLLPGTVWLSNSVTKMGSRKFLGTLSLFVVALLVVCYLIVVYLGPLLARGWNGIGDYQPNVYTYYGNLNVAGEGDAQHESTLTFVYTNHLLVVEVPASNTDRTTVTHAPAQIMKHPRIVGFHWGGAHAGAPDLEVVVESDYLTLNSPTFVFTFSNHAKDLSADPNSTGYHVAQFQFLSVVEV